MRAMLAWPASLVMASAIGAQSSPPTVIASQPSRVAVTIYRDPNRRGGQRIDANAPRGFALVSETRTVRVPAGVSVVRFEGVVGGIVPVSAVITGLPGGTVEKNRDARLLSPAALIDGSLGRQVTLRRTNRATGAVREEEATIVAGPASGVVLRTAAGIETLRCSGLAESPIYDGVPPGLSARPVLSVTTRSPRAAVATVTLSYLASDFDWSASYVATVAEDGGTLDLFAWMTLANANAETLVEADVNAIAGRLERRQVDNYRRRAGALRLACYPLGTTTSDLRSLSRQNEDIIVTGSRRMFGEVAAMAPPPPPPPPAPLPPPPEDLGDVKLYRVPMRVTIAARQQKQVALLQQDAVPYERIYRADLQIGNRMVLPARIELKMRNEAAGGLGIALPAGSTALYQVQGGERRLIGLGTVGDTANGQRFAIAAGVSSQVIVTQVVDARRRVTVTVTNANSVPVTLEVRLGSPGQGGISGLSTPLRRVDGVWRWTPVIAANGTATLSYSI